MLVGINPVDEEILQPEEQGPRIFAEPGLVFLYLLVDPNLFEDPLEGETIVAPERDDAHAVALAVGVVGDWNEH